MKKLLLIFIPLVILLSCGRDEEDRNSNNLIGKWKITSIEGKIISSSGVQSNVYYGFPVDQCGVNDYYDFRSNNTVEIKSSAKGNSGNCETKVATDNYSYNVNKKELTTSFFNNTNTDETYQVKTLNSKELILYREILSSTGNTYLSVYYERL